MVLFTNVQEPFRKTQYGRHRGSAPHLILFSIQKSTIMQNLVLILRITWNTITDYARHLLVKCVLTQILHVYVNFDPYEFMKICFFHGLEDNFCLAELILEIVQTHVSRDISAKWVLYWYTRFPIIIIMIIIIIIIIIFKPSNIR